MPTFFPSNFDKQNDLYPIHSTNLVELRPFQLSHCKSYCGSILGIMAPTHTQYSLCIDNTPHCHITVINDATKRKKTETDRSGNNADNMQNGIQQNDLPK